MMHVAVVNCEYNTIRNVAKTGVATVYYHIAELLNCTAENSFAPPTLVYTGYSPVFSHTLEFGLLPKHPKS